MGLEQVWVCACGVGVVMRKLDWNIFFVFRGYLILRMRFLANAQVPLLTTKNEGNICDWNKEISDGKMVTQAKTMKLVNDPN